jgi:hypothetical protein
MQNFEIIRDAPRLACKMCKNAKLDVVPIEKERIVILCEPCKIVEYVTREEWARVFE